jgi:hypothetical protein
MEIAQVKVPLLAVYATLEHLDTEGTSQYSKSTCTAQMQAAAKLMCKTLLFIAASTSQKRQGMPLIMQQQMQ